MKIEAHNDLVSSGKYSKRVGQAAKEDDRSPDGVGFPQGNSVSLSPFDPNTTQTNALLNIRDNQFNIIL